MDNDCDGLTDELCACDYLGESEGVCANGTNNGAGGCDPPFGYEAVETLCDGLDNDCDGTTDPGCECVNSETQPCGSNVGECHEGTQTCNGGVWGVCVGEIPPTAEVCDGLDNDCDGTADNGVLITYYLDDDGDGYGDAAVTHQACSPPSGYVADDTDCDDSMETVNPGADELCDRLDTDCSQGGGVVPAEDADEDGHAPEGTTVCSGGPLPLDDCCDSNANAYPGQTQYFSVPYEEPQGGYSYDYNCDGQETPQQASSGCYSSGFQTCEGTGPWYSSPPACGDPCDYRICFYNQFTMTCQSVMETRGLPCH